MAGTRGGNTQDMVGSIIGVIISLSLVAGFGWDWWRHPEETSEPMPGARMRPTSSGEKRDR